MLGGAKRKEAVEKLRLFAKHSWDDREYNKDNIFDELVELVLEHEYQLNPKIDRIAQQCIHFNALDTPCPFCEDETGTTNYRIIDTK